MWWSNAVYSRRLMPFQLKFNSCALPMQLARQGICNVDHQKLWQNQKMWGRSQQLRRGRHGGFRDWPKHHMSESRVDVCGELHPISLILELAMGPWLLHQRQVQYKTVARFLFFQNTATRPRT